ncbi:MAG: pyrroline-5-carboxylate reductase [Planctomycetota bacterium]|nr:MAG: pyrroline-5-carboxylate reductase [Planctomycetota bacterium]
MAETGRFGIIGFGKLGEAVALGLLGSGVLARERITASVRSAASAERARRRSGLEVLTDNRAVVERSDTVLLAVKPQVVPAVLAEIAPVLRAGQLLISACASVSTAAIEKALGGEPAVVRVMPNTPVLVGAGMSVLARGRFASPEHLATAERIFGAVGRTAVLDEQHLDAVTGLSGSGPAYIYLVIESLAEAGVKLGIPREVSTLLAAQTVLGAARMVLELGEHPALLKDVVTTPAGCTIDGLLELEDGKLRVTLVKAVVKAAERARNLTKDRL